jgi:hypothetical protein
MKLCKNFEKFLKLTKTYPTHKREKFMIPMDSKAQKQAPSVTSTSPTPTISSPNFLKITNSMTIPSSVIFSATIRRRQARGTTSSETLASERAYLTMKIY